MRVLSKIGFLLSVKKKGNFLVSLQINDCGIFSFRYRGFYNQASF